MRKLVPAGCLSLAFAALSTAALAKPIEALPPRGAPQSWVYDIASVHEASTARDVVRVIHWFHGDPLSAGAMLHVISDPRPPATGTRPSLQVWEIGNFLHEVRAVRVNEDVVTIVGVDNGGKSVSCGYRLRFDQGLLTRTLDELGCKAS